MANPLNASTTSGEDALVESTGIEKLAEVKKQTGDSGIDNESVSLIDQFSTRVKSWIYKQQCLNLQSHAVLAGAVSNDDWQHWLGKPKLKTIGGTEFLESGQQDDDYFLRQTLIPSEKGSPRVSISANLKPRRTYRISQRIFLEPGFDWGRKNQGGKIGFGFGGGSTPTGGKVQPDGFTARFMWRGNGDDTARIAVYSYAADRTQNLPYGDDHPLNGFDVPIGEWFTLMMEVTTNSAVDTADGSLKAWANGQQLVELDNILWQSEGDKPAIQKLLYSTFYGGASIDWAPLQPTFIRFADVCWAPVVEGYSAITPE